MKSRSHHIAKTISLSIIFSFLLLGLHANNLNIQNNLQPDEKQAQKKIQNSPNMELFNELEIVEEQKEIESWMFELQLQNDPFSEQKYMEEWMFHDDFWNIIKTDKKEKVVEEPRDVEDWMDKFGMNKTNLNPTESSGIHHLLYEDAFLIL